MFLKFYIIMYNVSTSRPSKKSYAGCTRETKYMYMCVKTTPSRCRLISCVKIWGGGVKAYNFEIWGGGMKAKIWGGVKAEIWGGGESIYFEIWGGWLPRLP